MKLNFNAVVLTDLYGNTTNKNMGKELGDFLYNKTDTLDWLDIAKAIHKGEEVEFTDLNIRMLIEYIKHPACTFLLIEKDALITYLSGLLEPLVETE